MDGAEGPALHQLDQRPFDQFKNRQEADHHAEAPFAGFEQFHEGHEFPAFQAVQHVRHALPGGQFLPRHLVVLEHVRPVQHFLEGQQQLAQVHVRLRLFAHVLGAARGGDLKIPLLARQVVDVLGGLLEALVFLQPADQLGARVLRLVLFIVHRSRQQGARFNLAQHRRHHQIFRGQLQVHGLHQLHVLHVLSRDLGHGDVENIQVLPLDQVQQQIQRAFERLQEHFQGVRRYVEIVGQLGDRLAVHQAERHLRLVRRRRRQRVTGLRDLLLDHFVHLPWRPMVNRYRY